MLTGYPVRQARDLLTSGEAERVHNGALEVLARTGVVFGSEAPLLTLQRAGCTVDGASGRVRFPEQLVQECVQQCPSQFTLKARCCELDLDIGPGRLYVQSHPGLVLVDLESGERRLAHLADIGPMVGAGTIHGW